MLRKDLIGIDRNTEHSTQFAMSRKVDFGMALILTVVVVEGCWTDAEKKGI